MKELSFLILACCTGYALCCVLDIMRAACPRWFEDRERARRVAEVGEA